MENILNKTICIEDYLGNEITKFEVDEKGNIKGLIKNGSIADITLDNEVRIQSEEKIQSEYNFFKEEIYNYINNTENEEFCKISDEEVDKLVDKVVDKVMCDDEMNTEINNTIEWYVNHAIYEEVR